MLGRSDGVKEGESEMEQSKEKISLGRVLGERVKQVFCHDSVLALEITVEVYLEIVIQFWRSSSEQCGLANAIRRFGTFVTSKNHQALRNLGKVCVASERENVAKVEGGGQWVSI